MAWNRKRKHGRRQRPGRHKGLRSLPNARREYEPLNFLSTDAALFIALLHRARPISRSIGDLADLEKSADNFPPLLPARCA